MPDLGTDLVQAAWLHCAVVRHSVLLAALALVASCAKAPPGPETKPEASKESRAQTNPEPSSGTASTRPREDLDRDADRKPQAVMDFFEVESGDRVVELMAGGGYYVHLLAERVGGEGKVWAHNSPFVLERFAEKLIAARMAMPGLDNVERLDTPLDAPELPSDLDAVFLVLFFHDTYWQEVDRAKMLTAIYEALEPGGVFGVVDHHAEAGSKDRDVKKLHRIDAAFARKEIEAAGFVLDAESDVLEVSTDNRKTNVFAPKMRGKTDRFVYRFRKPG